MTDFQRTYLPAAGHDWTLPLYDPLVKLLGIHKVRSALLDQAALQATHSVLDIGCGTGTLATLVKRLYRNVEVVGLDPDPKALARAKRKATRAAVSVRFDQGFAHELPYPQASFDRVFSSFMFHHLRADLREKTLREVRRVIAPGGSLHLVDFARPEEQAVGWWERLLYSRPHLKDNSASRILRLFSQAGFERPKKVRDGAILNGLFRIAYYQASVPTSNGEFAF
jgi:ubiquinone/menaquinone biosynthesis C-methylase UbiE